jgi:hypothetical protein
MVSPYEGRALSFGQAGRLGVRIKLASKAVSLSSDAAR